MMGRPRGRGGPGEKPARRNPAPTTGELGERAAERWLRWRGFRILARNARTRWGEIDLLTRRFGRVAAVEVKTSASSSSQAFGPLAERLHRAQLERLRRALESHVAARRARALAIDLITVTIERRPGRRPRTVDVCYLPDVSLDD